MEIQIIDGRIGTEWPTPKYQTEAAAGIDLYACLEERTMRIWPGDAVLIPTGIALAIPEGHAGFIYPRSSIGHAEGVVLGNGTGVIDADYRGQVMVSALNRNRTSPIEIVAGQRIAQIVIQPIRQEAIEIVDVLSGTERGDGGFGSTGNA